jgi:hypothetical protein
MALPPHGPTLTAAIVPPALSGLEEAVGRIGRRDVHHRDSRLPVGRSVTVPLGNVATP